MTVSTSPTSSGSSAEVTSSSSSTLGWVAARPGDRDPLLLATGQLIGIRSSAVAEADRVQPCEGSLAGLRPGHPPHVDEPEHDVL